MIAIFMLSAQPADQSVVLSGSVTRFFADAINRLTAFINAFSRAQASDLFIAGILIILSLLVSERKNSHLFGIKKRWIASGIALGMLLALGLFLFVELVHDASFAYAGRVMRKSAHFFAYLILGVLVSHATKGSTTSTVWRRRGVSLLFCVAYAITDEFHQMFVPGRGPQVKDVLIDGSGAAIGILIYAVARKLWLYRRNM